MSVDPETKSDRERYIRVAAIDTVIREGNWNIYFTDGIRASHEVINKNVRHSTNLMSKMVFRTISNQ